MASSGQDEDANPPYIRFRMIDLQINQSPISPNSPFAHAYRPPSAGATCFPAGQLPSRVPVLRIFGTLPNNQKICANIHGVYPYFFVDYPKDQSLSPEVVHKFSHRVAVSLNAALNTSLRKSNFSNGAKTGVGVDPRTLHVASVVLVKGIPFYGYHVGYSYYLKISLVTPSHVYRAVGLLEGGSVMNKRFTCYESHLSMKLQFMIDFDLYGCGWVDLDGGKFRLPLPEPDINDSPDHYNSSTVPSTNLYLPSHISPNKESHSELEIDLYPWQIINRRRLQPRYLHDRLTELLHPESIDPNEKNVRSVKELWEENNRRRIELGLPITNTQVIDADNITRLVPSQGEAGFKGGDFPELEEWENRLEDKLKGERKLLAYSKGSRQKLGLPAVACGAREWDKWIMTSFESTENGWPKAIKTPSRVSISQRTRATQPSSPLARSSSHHPTDQDLGDSDSESEANPYEMKQSSLKPPSNEDTTRNGSPSKRPVTDADGYSDVDIDEEYALNFEINASQAEALQMEADARLEEEGFRGRVEVTPRKNGRYEEDQGGNSEDEEDGEVLGFLTQQVKKKQAAGVKPSPSSQQTPMKSTQRPRPGDSTSQGSAFPGTQDWAGKSSLKAFTGSQAFQSVSQDGRDRAMVNPYLPSHQQSSPIKSKPIPTTNGASTSTTVKKNPFQRTTPTKITDTPTKPTVRPKKGRPISRGTPLRESSSRDEMELEPLEESDDDMADEKPEPRKLKFEVDDVTSGQKVTLESSDGLPAAPMAQPSQTIPINKKRARDTVPTHDEALLEPTFMDAQARHPSLKTDTLGSTASLPATHISSNEQPSLDRPTKKARFDVEHQQPKTSTPLIPSTSIKSDSSVNSQLSKSCWRYAFRPPTRAEAAESLVVNDLPDIIYQPPYYSRPQDIGKHPLSFGGREFFVKGNGVVDLPSFQFSSRRPRSWRVSKRRKKRSTWTYSAPPPPMKVVNEWLEKEKNQKKSKINLRPAFISQWGGPTQARQTQKKKVTNTQRETASMSVLSLEVFAPSQGDKLPNPLDDPIVAIFYSLVDNDIDLGDHPYIEDKPGYYSGIIMVSDSQLDPHRLGTIPGVNLEFVESEFDLFQTMIEKVRVWDPDVLAGYEVHTSSYGYLVDRARATHGDDLSSAFSRAIAPSHTGGFSAYNQTHSSSVRVIGRHVFNIWRILRGDLTLLQYSFENVAFHLLKNRVPHYSPRVLTEWYNSKIPEQTIRLLQYFTDRVTMYNEMIDAADIVTKNAEFARVFGVDFNSVMSRGSQFKVESFVFRIAKPESFMLVSPSRESVGKQNAAEAIPLIFEPQSGFYRDPVVVLDFQSLYPSVMIGYNYCYSTCLGRVELFKGKQKLGWMNHVLPPGLVDLLMDQVTISPNGIVFAKQTLRKSLLSKMLGEILATRVMVKQAMKLAKGDKTLTKILNARQLGLKLMANVTYGYTGASFSGRMPCVEIADAIVQTGRRTLERAIRVIEETEKWKAFVVYGDTDSLFVHLPGRTREEAHRLGNEIADVITALNPKPVKLKFEKVYSACLLMAKKRYVGNKHENIDDVFAVFDAKGIETIRRDGFPAGQKMMETVIKMLFTNPDISLVKRYCQTQWLKLLTGRVSIQDFTLAKEVKLGSYSDKGPPPPGVMVASRKLTLDARNEAEYGERVPYVIIQNKEKHRLVDRARAPEDLLADRTLKLDGEYYILKQLIPPLNRVLTLLGVNALPWYEQMPKPSNIASWSRITAGPKNNLNGLNLNGNNNLTNGDGKEGKSGVGVGMKSEKVKQRKLDMVFKTEHCVVCGMRTDDPDTVCEKCRFNLDTTSHALLSRYHLSTQRLVTSHRICSSCSSTPLSEPQQCDSLDCPVLYARVKAERDVDDLKGVPRLMKRLMKAQGVGGDDEEEEREVVVIDDDDD